MGKLKKKQVMKSIGIKRAVQFGLLGVLFTGAIVSCKKYEDGPDISLIPRKERVANTWIFAYAVEDGQNVSQNFDQYELYMNTDGDATLDANYQVFGVDTETTTNGTWTFQNDQENLRLDFEDDSQDGVYEIKRLTSDELWLKDVSRDLEIHLLEK
eukprot:GDKH01012828.1.p1 GENE.GDKH01012828.1~~GDKH01012828.1.p1  ORF type:complete len:156 (+),score=9.91 GDKH01012828.1:1-468(+)